MVSGREMSQFVLVSCVIESCFTLRLYDVLALCINLTDPDNGVVSLNGTREGSKATYNCSVGYNLVGNGTRTCQSDGQWSGSDPTCLSKTSWIFV